MRRSIVRVLFVLNSFHFLFVSCDFESHNRTGGLLKCEEILQHWINQSTSKFHHQNSTLEVSVQPLLPLSRARECFGKSQISLELYRVNNSSSQDEEFGTSSYYSKFERCQRLEPEVFVYHSERPIDLDFNRTSSSEKSIVQFHHVVERDYILRVCPCSRARHGHHSTLEQQTICDCPKKRNLRPTCSGVIRVDENPEAKVFQWCRPNFDDAPENVKIQVHSPVVSCTSVLFTGSIVSCTPIQSYDRVRLSLFSMDNTGNSTCNEHKDFGHDSPITIEAVIKEGNGSSGEFSQLSNVFSPSTNYCLLVEIVDHPYCGPNLLIDHNPSNGVSQIPKNCRIHLKAPVQTPSCAKNIGQVVSQEGSNVYVVFIFAVALATLVGIVLVCLICAYNKIKNICPRKRKEIKEKEAGVHRCRLGMPVSNFSTHSLDSASLKNYLTGNGAPSKTDKDADTVFLLRVSNNVWNDDVQEMFRAWIESLGCAVRDIHNPKEEEAINADPEGWVNDVLTHPRVRVIVVEEYTPHVNSHGHGKEAIVLEMRSFGLNAAPSTSCTDSTSLAESSSSSLGERHQASDCGSQFEIDPLMDDPRFNLTVYATKLIQSHFSGKYNQVIFVRFCPDANVTPHLIHNSSFSSLVTPLRKSFVIPYHLPEIRDWLRPRFSRTRLKSNAFGEKDIETCEMRLRSALTCSVYNCI